MGYYVLAVGGTGNKILESLVYLAAVDGLYTQDESGKTAPLPDVTMLSGLRQHHTGQAGRGKLR